MKISPPYTLMGIELMCTLVHTSSDFSSEAASYTYLKNITTKGGYKYIRVDTVGQIGFPDILLLKGADYCMIEAKRLKQKSLVSLEDSLTWQFGQIAFAVRAFTLGLSYAITVCRDNDIVFIGQEHTLCNLTQNLNY